MIDPGGFVAVVLEASALLYYLGVAAQAARVRRLTGRPPLRWPGDSVGRLSVVGALAWPLLPLARACRPAWFAAVPRMPGLENWPARACGLLLVCLAGALTAKAWADLGERWRLGADASDRPGFASAGVYAHVRHPVHSAFWLALLGFFLLSPNIVFALLWAAGSSAAAARADAEERRNLELHGKPYRDHTLVTGKFFPLWY